MARGTTPDSTKRPEPVDVHVGQRIRLQRMMQGMSQETLGKACGVSFQQIQKYEKGVNRVGSSRLQQIAAVLSVSPAFFFEDLPSTDRGGARIPALNQFLGTMEGMKLVTAFMSISDPNMRRAILSVVRAAAGQED